MGSDVGVQTPVYHRGSDPEMVFSARSRARMGSDVGVQTPVPPPLGPGPGPLCVAFHVTIRYARLSPHGSLGFHELDAEPHHGVVFIAVLAYKGYDLALHVVSYAAVSAILG